MPPKSKPDGEEVGVYDVEVMNEDELKKYIEALKQESERMKTAFAEHQTGERELEDALKQNILNKHELLTKKEIGIQKLINESNDILKTEQKDQMIRELDTNRELAQNATAAFTEMQEVRLFQQEELKNLRKNLGDREREVDSIHLVHNFIATDLKELTEAERDHMTENNETSLEDISKEFSEKYLEEKLILLEAQKNTMSATFGSLLGENSNKLPSTNEAEMMTCYFKDVFSKNITVRNHLKAKVESLEKELNKMNLLLKDAERENKNVLKSTKYPPQSKESTVLEIDGFDGNQLDYLTYENYALQEKLRQVTAERDILRNKFISAMRNIYEKADFASFLAEQMIVSLMNNLHCPEEILNEYLKENELEAILKASRANEEYDKTESESTSSSRTF